MITLAQAHQLCRTPAGRAAIEVFLPHLNDLMPIYGIESPAAIAAFLAQIAHESQDFTRVVENLNYSAQGLANTWPNRYSIEGKGRTLTPNALALGLQRDPEAIANNVYANRLGNGDEASGDGWKFRGRGLKQLTGRANYELCGAGIGQDLINYPDLLRQPRYAVESACWYWRWKQLTPLAEAGDFEAVTKGINGGLIGIDDRKAYLARATDALSALA